MHKFAHISIILTEFCIVFFFLWPRTYPSQLVMAKNCKNSLFGANLLYLLVSLLSNHFLYLQVSQAGQGVAAAMAAQQQGQSGSSHTTTTTAGMLGSPFSAAAALGLNPLAAYGSAGIAGMPGLQGFPLGM